MFTCQQGRSAFRVLEPCLDAPSRGCQLRGVEERTQRYRRCPTPTPDVQLCPLVTNGGKRTQLRRRLTQAAAAPGRQPVCGSVLWDPVPRDSMLMTSGHGLEQSRYRSQALHHFRPKAIRSIHR